MYCNRSCLCVCVFVAGGRSVSELQCLRLSERFFHYVLQWTRLCCCFSRRQSDVRCGINDQRRARWSIRLSFASVERSSAVRSVRSACRLRRLRHAACRSRVQCRFGASMDGRLPREPGALCSVWHSQGMSLLTIPYLLVSELIDIAVLFV